MSKRAKSYFFSSVVGPLGKLFNTGNIPNKRAFVDLFDSVTVKMEAGDTATTTEAGHIKLATETELMARTETDSLGHKKTMTPAQLPIVDSVETSCYDDSGVAYGSRDYNPTSSKNNGIEVLIIRKGISGKRYRVYVVKHLANTDMFQYNAETKALELKNGGVLNAHLNGNIAVTKLASLGKGVFIVGGSTNTTVGLDTDGQFIVCDTRETSGVKAVVMSGDATMNENGVLTIEDKAITLAKMNDIIPGGIIAGPTGISAGTPVVIDCSGDAKIVIGTGTGIASVSISGVISITKTGATSFSDGVLKARHIHSDLPGIGLELTGSGDAKKLDVKLGSGLEVDSENRIVPTYTAPLEYTFTGTTTDDTKTELFVNGEADNRLSITGMTLFEVTTMAKQTDGTAGSAGDCYARKAIGIIKNISDTVSLVGTVVELFADSDVAFSGVQDEEADDTNNSLKISVTGEVDKTIEWNVTVKITII